MDWRAPCHRGEEEEGKEEGGELVEALSLVL